MLALLRLVSLRHFVTSPLRTALTVGGVAIGVATLLGIAAINRTVLDAFRSTIDTIAGKADLTVGGQRLDEGLLEVVRKVPGVAHAAGTLTVVAPVKDSPGERLYVMGVDLLDDGYFRDYRGVDRDVGALADDLEFLNSTDRLLLAERFARAHGLKTGSTLLLQTAEGTKSFVVHGLLQETGPLKAFGGAMGVMFFGGAQEAFGRGRTFDRIDLAVDPKVGWEAVQRAVQAAVGPAYEVERPERRGQSVETMMRSFQLGLNLGSAVALMVGVFLIYNTVSIGVVQRRREIGTLRALGATRRRVRWLFTLEAALLGGLGSLLGMPLGVLLARAAIAKVMSSVSSVYVQVNTSAVTVNGGDLLFAVGLGVAGSVFAALRPASVASRVQPVEALRRDVAAGAGAVSLRSWPTMLGGLLLLLAWPATWIPPPAESFSLGGYLAVFMVLLGMTLLAPVLVRALDLPLRLPGELLFGLPGRLAADNFGRAPVRTAVPVSALAVGVTMAVTVACFTGSFQHSAWRWIEQAVPGDLFVTSSNKLSGVRNMPMDPALGDELGKLPGVEDIDRLRLFQHDVLGLRVYLISVTPEVYDRRAKPIVLAGALPDAAARRQGRVVVSENFARRRQLEVGSTFPVKTPTGEHPYTVAAIIVDYTSDQGSILLSRDTFTAQFKDDRVDSFRVYVKPGASLEEVRQRITARYGAQYDLYVLTNAELRKEAMQLVDDAFAVTYAMELLAMLLALLGVVNTLLAAVIDRTRELGLLRAVGASRAQVLKLITAEAGFIGLCGGTLGLLSGAVVGYIVTRVVGVEGTGWNFPFEYAWAAAGQMLAGSVVCAVLAGLYPARRAASLDVVEALAYE